MLINTTSSYEILIWNPSLTSSPLTPIDDKAHEGDAIWVTEADCVNEMITLEQEQGILLSSAPSDANGEGDVECCDCVS